MGYKTATNNSSTYKCLSVAFDTVDHYFVLDLLQRKFGIITHSTVVVQELPKTKKIQSLINVSYLSEQIMNFNIPKGSTQGAYLFNCYALTLSEIVMESLSLKGFTGDHSIRRTFKPEKRNTNKDNKHHQKVTPS